MNLNSIGKTATLLLRLADSRKATVPLIKTPDEKRLSSREPIRDPLPDAAPEAVGVPSGDLSAFFRDLAAEPSIHMHTVLVAKDGHVIARAGFGEHEFRIAKTTFSACKSITALAVGMLVDEGKLHVDDPVLPFFDDLSLSPIAKLRYRSLKLEDLLTMRAGAEFAEADAMAEVNWLHGFFSSSAAGTIGETFRYNSICTYVLSAIVQKITGKTLFDFLNERLFTPLGITDVFWETSPEGITKGGWGLYIRPDDLAKIGQTVLSDGELNGRRYVSREWIRAMTAAQVRDPVEGGKFHYGYQVWVHKEHDAFLFNGMLGQNVLGIRKNNLLFVSNAGNDEVFQISYYFDAVSVFYDRDYGSTPLPADRAAQKELENTLADLRRQDPVPQVRGLRRLFGAKAPAIPAECGKWAGRTFETDDADAVSVGFLPVFLQVLGNNYTSGLVSVRFERDVDTFFAIFAEKDEEHRVPVGFGTAAESAQTFHGVPYFVFCRGRFAQNEDGVPVLVLTVAFPETACTRTVKLFLAPRPTLCISEQPGGPFVSQFLMDSIGTLSEKPVIGTAVSHVNDDYIRYRVDAVFSPRIQMKETDEKTKKQED